EFQVCAGFRTEGYPMSKPDEYRANAQECQRMAGISRNPNEKVIWQQMSQHWLSMVPKAEPPEAEHGAGKNRKVVARGRRELRQLRKMKGAAGARTTCSGVRVVHGRVRYARPERGEGAAGGV